MTTYNESFTALPIIRYLPVADLQAENGNFAGGHYISLPDFSEEVIHTLQQIVDGTPARDIQPHNGGEPQTYLNYRHLKLHNTDSNLYPLQCGLLSASSEFL